MIQVLEKQVADKIAAGEVVDRPLSVVKELAENAIDAGATTIVCEIKKGGKEYIRITDNGCGIPEQEVNTAFLRHATSKIIEAKDLNTVETLGFRGEALASISAVSRLEIITKTASSRIGTQESLIGGKAINNQAIGCETGTTIIVEDLFFNTPARLAFLKSDASESRMVIDFMAQIALAYSNIRVRMVNNGNTLFSTRGDGDRRHTIMTLNDRQFTESLVPIAGKDQNNSMNINGYVSKPGSDRASRKNQVFFVNGRVISSKLMQKAVDKGYKERIFPGRHPVAFLFLEIPPKQLDVNIHPNKREIRFHDEDAVSQLISSAIVSGISMPQSMPEAPIGTSSTGNNAVEGLADHRLIAPKDRGNAVNKEINNSKPTEGENKEKRAQEQHQVDIKQILSGFRNEGQKIAEQISEFRNQLSLKNKDENFDFSHLHYIGNLFKTYLLLSYNDTFFIMDQHAAHERVNFERLVEGYKRENISSQELIAPFTFDSGFTQEEWIEPLRQLGYNIESFGPRTYAVRSIPMGTTIEEARMFVSDFMDTVTENTDFTDPKTIEKIATKACKSSVRGGDLLSPTEVTVLLSQLSKCKNPYSCPHGRPTFIRMDKNEIERRFMRV